MSRTQFPLSDDALEIALEETPEGGGSPGVNSLISYNRKLRDQLLEARSTHAEELRGIKDQVREIEKSKHEAEARLDAARASFASEKAVLDARAAKLLELREKEKQEYENQAQAQLDTIGVLQKQLDNLAGDLTRSVSRGGSLEKLKITLLEKARALKSELAEARAGSDALAGNLEQLTAERDSLRRELTALSESHSKLGTLEGHIQAIRADLQEVREERDDLLEELEALADSKARLDEAERRIQAVQEQLAQATAQRDALDAKLKSLAEPLSRLEQLRAQNEALEARLKEQEQEFLKAREYRVHAEAREAENKRLAALAEEKVKIADGAVKAQQAAEQLAFESRRKLLDAYSESEGKEILKANAEEAIARVAALEAELEASRKESAEWQAKHKELEDKLLYSSERDILKRSLESIAKRKSISDSI